MSPFFTELVILGRVILSIDSRYPLKQTPLAIHTLFKQVSKNREDNNLGSAC